VEQHQDAVSCDFTLIQSKYHSRYQQTTSLRDHSRLQTPGPNAEKKKNGTRPEQKIQRANVMFAQIIMNRAYRALDQIQKKTQSAKKRK